MDGAWNEKRSVVGAKGCARPQFEWEEHEAANIYRVSLAAFVTFDLSISLPHFLELRTLMPRSWGQWLSVGV